MPVWALECIPHLTGERTMKALLNRYRANPTAANHAAVMAYSRKHPFAEILLAQADAALFYEMCNYPVKTA